MKALLKLAVGAAIAGALVNLLLKQRTGRGQVESQDPGGLDLPSGDDVPRGTSQFTLGELAAESGAGADETRRGTLNS